MARRGEGLCLSYNSVSGDYRFTGLIADDAAGRSAHLAIDGVSLGDVTLPASGGWDSFLLVHLGSAHVEAGTHALRYVFDSGSTSTGFSCARRSPAGDAGWTAARDPG